MYKVTTPPTTEQILSYIPLDDVKLQLGISHDAFDARLTDTLLAAYAWAESFTGRALLPQTVVATFASWGDVELTRTPLQSITTVKYYVDDTLETMESSDYRLLAGSELSGDFYFKATPSHDTVPDAIQITYAAGWEESSKIPADVKSAILMRAADLWNSRTNRPDAKLSLAERLLCGIKVVRV